MRLIDKDFKEMFSSQMISIIGGLIAGTIIAAYTDKLLLIPGMLILLPGFLEMRGNISGAFASRLSSGLFLGVVKPTLKKTHLIKGNIFASLIEAVIISAALGLIAFTFNFFIVHEVTYNIIFIPLIAGIIANVIEIPLTLVATFWLFRKGHDPNNFMGPFVTSTGDITSVIALLIALVIV